jgi:DNA-binding Lrp family transcriptional regulator
MDYTDCKILMQIQRKADTPLTEVANYAGVSKTACWNRIRRLEERGVIEGRHTKLCRFSLGLPVVVFLAITVKRHTNEWVNQFKQLVDQYPQIIEVHRLTGANADYQLKMVCKSIEDYDNLQQELIGKIEFNSMSSQVSLLELKNSSLLPVTS